MQSVNPDFKDLLKCLNQEKAKYLVVGGYAVIYYTEPRYTKDIDIWISTDEKNAARVFKALKEFGTPLHDLETSDLMNKRLVYQIGVEPNRIDVLMDVDGIAFTTAWKNKKVSRYGDEKIFLIAKKDLIRAKKKTNRPQDQIDVLNLLGKT